MAAQKDALIKFTISLPISMDAEENRLSADNVLKKSFPELYELDFFNNKDSTHTFGLSSILWTNEIVTIIPAKSSNRFR